MVGVVIPYRIGMCDGETSEGRRTSLYPVEWASGPVLGTDGRDRPMSALPYRDPFDYVFSADCEPGTITGQSQPRADFFDRLATLVDRSASIVESVEIRYASGRRTVFTVEVSR